MHVDQESVFDNLKYSTQKTQYTHDTLMDTWKRDKSHSSERFLNFQNTRHINGYVEKRQVAFK